MKNRFINFTLSIALLTCTACSQTAMMQKQLHSADDAEAAGVRKATAAIKENCTVGTDEHPTPRKDVMKAYECWDKYIAEYAVPVAMFPDLVNDMRLKRRKLDLDYKKGKIDWDEKRIKAQEIMNDFTKVRSQRIQETLNEAHEQDVQNQQQLQQSLQNLSNYNQQQQIIQQQQSQQMMQQMPRQTSTHCYSYTPNSMDCNTQ